jgi:hypothetical protein
MVFLTILCLLLALGGFLLWRQMGRLSERIARLTQRVYNLENPRDAASEEQSTPVPAVEEPPPVAAADDWEAIVGTSWLNRVGALVLVIGIALFLGYSLTHLGPAGKIAIGFAVGSSMLAAGLALKRQARYSNFALSLVGGGWATIYFTGHAMHGIEAARMIASPVAGAMVLLAISAAMILHALRYRSETATALAFLFAFASLNLTPLTPFSAVATAVLGASLLYVATTFCWMRLAIAGTILTYSTFILRYDPPTYGQAVPTAQATLWIYWTLFECFDLLDLRKRGPHAGIDRSLFLLNAAGFVGASLLSDWRMTSTDWAEFFATASAAYLVSALLRARLIKFSTDQTGVERMWSGGYEAAGAAAAALFAAALINRFSGLRMTLALLMEGELILLGGLALRNQLVQKLAGVVLFGCFLRLIAVNIPASDQVSLLGLNIHSWAPLALVMAAAFCANRIVRGGGAWYISGAAFLITAVVYDAVEGRLLTVALGLEGATLLAIGFALRERALRLAGLIIFLLCIAKLFVYDLRELDTLSRIFSFVILGVMLLASSWVYTRFREKLRKLL